MKFLRVIGLAALMAAAFVLITSRTGLWPRVEQGSTEEKNSLWSGPEVGRAAGLSSDELNNIEVYRSAHPATVFITSTVYRRDFFFDIVPAKETGSGFFVNAEGLIVTNNHVISGSQKLEVTMADQTRYTAQIVDRDPSNDLALIRVAPKAKVPYLRLGDSDKIQVGQKVLAIGNPFGLSGTLTTGIVSSLGRNIRDEGGQTLEGMIQSDAAINPGNSGGPLLDSQGNVIGVNTAIYGPGGNIGIGFAMPINRAKVMMEGFQSRGGKGRPRLGVNGTYIAGDLAVALELPREGGFLVYEVGRGSPAADAGIRPANRSVYIGNAEVGIGGDLIMSIDGQKVDRGDAIARALIRKKAGDTIVLKVFRQGRTLDVKVNLGASEEQAL
ncbi:MAG: trypsin-like peptidase domain-containing protein [Bryobacteraceae bacterium]